MDITDQQKSPSIAVATLEDVQRDLGALRNDVSRLSKEVSSYVSETSRKASGRVHREDRPALHAERRGSPRLHLVRLWQ